MPPREVKAWGVFRYLFPGQDFMLAQHCARRYRVLDDRRLQWALIEAYWIAREYEEVHDEAKRLVLKTKADAIVFS